MILSPMISLVGLLKSLFWTIWTVLIDNIEYRVLIIWKIISHLSCICKDLKIWHLLCSKWNLLEASFLKIKILIFAQNRILTDAFSHYVNAITLSFLAYFYCLSLIWEREKSIIHCSKWDWESSQRSRWLVLNIKFNCPPGLNSRKESLSCPNWKFLEMCRITDGPWNSPNLTCPQMNRHGPNFTSIIIISTIRLNDT